MKIPVVVVETINSELIKAFQPFGCETSSKTLCEGDKGNKIFLYKTEAKVFFFYANKGSCFSHNVSDSAGA